MSSEIDTEKLAIGHFLLLKMEAGRCEPYYIPMTFDFNSVCDVTGIKCLNKPNFTNSLTSVMKKVTKIEKNLQRVEKKMFCLKNHKKKFYDIVLNFVVID